MHLEMVHGILSIKNSHLEYTPLEFTQTTEPISALPVIAKCLLIIIDDAKTLANTQILYLINPMKDFFPFLLLYGVFVYGG